MYANDVTFRRMEDNLKHLSLKGKNALEYILNERNPKKNRPVPYIDYIDKSLNESQKTAIENALSCENFYLIHGPFGTGKTRTLVELISQETRQNHKVLATAESNAAVDNILERLMENKKLNLTRLGHPQRVSKHNITQTLAYKVENHRLNKKIREPKGEKELILISEALHEKKIAEIAQKIKDHGNVKMVLIAGPSSSGKTTFAGKLGMSLRVNGIKPVTLSVDNYFVERKDNPKDEHGNYDFECIVALDLDLFNSQLVDLLNGKEVALPTFNFTTGSKEYRGNTLKLKEDEILIIEGIHCLNDRLTSLIPKENKFKVYISDLTVLNIDYYNRISTTDTRLIRRIVRDYQFRNYSAEHTLKTWYSVNRGEQKNIFPYQEEAHVMFNSSIVYELAVLKKYAMPLLEAIPESSREYSEARRLIALLKYFENMDDSLIPNNSLLREFIGGSIFEH